MGDPPAQTIREGDECWSGPTKLLVSSVDSVLGGICMKSESRPLRLSAVHVAGR